MLVAGVQGLINGTKTPDAFLDEIAKPYDENLADRQVTVLPGRAADRGPAGVRPALLGGHAVHDAIGRDTAAPARDQPARSGYVRFYLLPALVGSLAGHRAFRWS